MSIVQFSFKISYVLLYIMLFYAFLWFPVTIAIHLIFPFFTCIQNKPFCQPMCFFYCWHAFERIYLSGLCLYIVEELFKKKEKRMQSKRICVFDTYECCKFIQVCYLFVKLLHVRCSFYMALLQILHGLIKKYSTELQQIRLHFTNYEVLNCTGIFFACYQIRMSSLLIKADDNPLFASFNYVEIQRKYESLYDSINLYNRLDRELVYALCYPKIYFVFI